MSLSSMAGEGDLFQISIKQQGKPLSPQSNQIKITQLQQSALIAQLMALKK